MGLKIIGSDVGDVNFVVFFLSQVFNQKALDSTYTDAFDNTKSVKQRQDMQLNKVNIKFFGWIMIRNFAICSMYGQVMLHWVRFHGL